MKTPKFIFVAMIAITACNNMDKEQVQKIKDLATKDSTLLVQENQKDSSITVYLSELSQIQDNLDRIKQREKIITVNALENGSGNKQLVVDEVKQLDDWIIANDKRMNSLQAKLKKANTKNDNLENLVAHLTQEIAEKDKEIADLQARLSITSDSVRLLTSKLNDSIVEIKKQRSDMAALKTQMNTVYYVVGNIRQLEALGVIDKQGGFIGLGRVAEENPTLDNFMFTRTTLTKLKTLSLNGKFRRLITNHPDKSYAIYSGITTDSIVIITPTSFWSESKYLIVAVK